MENGFIIETNWSSLNNKDIKNAVNIKYDKNDSEEEWANLDEIVSEENAVFLECETSPICEVSLKVDLGHSIKNFTLITNCPKLEVFKGKQQEYVNTYFGDILDDFEGIRVCRFDVTISQPTVCELVIKLFPGDREFWIYGILVVLQQSLRPALQAMSKINFQNVQEMLSNSNLKLSSGAEKFLQNYMAGKTNAIPSFDSVAKACMSYNVPALNLANLTITDNGNCGKSFTINGNEPDQKTEDVSKECYELGENIKTYLNEQLKELETKMNQKLAQMEHRQVQTIQQMFNCLENAVSERLTEIENNQKAKLDKILEILENKTNS